MGGLVALALLAFAAPAAAVHLAPFGGGTFASPYHVVGAPGDPSRVFVVEGAGVIRLVRNGITATDPFLDIHEDVRFAGCSECGLLSMAPAPDYETNGLFYVVYTVDVTPGDHDLRLMEFRRSSGDPDVADESSGRVVLEIQHRSNFNHNGGQLQFGPDGYLYWSTGDGGAGGDPSDNAQDTQELLGKLLRIDPSGEDPGGYTVPTDNPYADSGDPGADEIYSVGLRNPWRFSFDRLTGDLSIGDVGQGSREEVDFAAAGTGLGANFGWNCFEGTLTYDENPPFCAELIPHHEPALDYSRGSSGAAAVVGGYVVRDGALPDLLGRYVFADTYPVFSGALRVTTLSAAGATGTADLGPTASFVTSFGQDACAHLYVVSGSGQVSRLEPDTGPFPCAPQSSTPPEDTTPPQLTVDLSGARTLGELKVAVGCDEACSVSASASIRVKPRPRAGVRKATLLADTDSIDLSAGSDGVLRLRLSADERRTVTRALNRGSRVVAGILVSATDTAGNPAETHGRVRQKR